MPLVKPEYTKTNSEFLKKKISLNVRRSEHVNPILSSEISIRENMNSKHERKLISPAHGSRSRYVTL